MIKSLKSYFMIKNALVILFSAVLFRWKSTICAIIYIKKDSLLINVSTNPLNLQLTIVNHFPLSNPESKYSVSPFLYLSFIYNKEHINKTNYLHKQFIVENFLVEKRKDKKEIQEFYSLSEINKFKSLFGLSFYTYGLYGHKHLWEVFMAYMAISIYGGVC